MREAAELVTFIVTQITGDAHCFQLESSLDENGVLLQLTVDKEYGGRVIGKKGTTALAIRNLLRALGTKNGAKYSLVIEVDDSE